MPDYRITYRQEVIISANSEEEATNIFNNLNLQDLENELGEGIIKHTQFIEEISFEEANIKSE